MTLLGEILEGESLNEGEVAVLRRAAAGDTVAETALALMYAAESIRTMRKRACAKLGARNTTNAVVRALDRGLFTIDAEMIS